MLNLDDFSDPDADSGDPAIEGDWFEIRVAPDMLTGEILNIGVGFIEAQAKTFHFKLLSSAAPFGCLYGARGKEQFDFLLETTRRTLTQRGPTAHISPHISLGNPRHAQGGSAQEIVDSLYANVVTLARRDGPADQTTNADIDEKCTARSTESVRKSIRKAFRKADPSGFTNYWRDTPVSIPVDDRVRNVDMQIWQPSGGLFGARCFGSIVSACYRDIHYRRSFLNGAYHDLTVARAYMQEGHGKGALFILCPTSGDNLTQIENEIDETTWVLDKKFGITPFVEHTIECLKDKSLAFMLENN